ncbi:MAG TPA: toxin TcdB middle/N-terminal domain-containing protein, partial [Verrucomicrobiae bacterium]|nr:toxin TcdB middle/N-terminal domain-containing protein [Verrucomicrobiae bacterium]
MNTEKSENRKPKTEGNPKLEFRTIRKIPLVVAAFGLRISGFFRISDFGFRICVLAVSLASFPLVAADKNGVSPTSISLPKGPGSIEGLGESFQPTLNTGTAKYGIGLNVPPGTAGQTPAPALRYEGGSGNGPLGFGWNLPLSYVQRRTDKGIPLYGENLNLGVDRSDVFINEMKEELVPQTNGFFFCKNEGAFIRYRPAGDHWEGTLPDGTRLEFGLSSNGRIEDTNSSPTRVFCWLLEKETDTRGNTITYSYESFPGPENQRQRFLRQIVYGPGSPPWQNFHFVVFEYEDRPDWFEDCRAGFVVRTGKRLKSIVVGTQGPSLSGHQPGDFNGDGQPDHLNRRYELSYLDYAGPETHWSLVSSVQMIGADGVSRFPAATFGYAICNPPQTLSALDNVLGGTNEPLSVMDNDSVDLADLNGDGLPDVLRTFPGGGAHQGFLNRGISPAGGAKAVGWSDAVEIGGDERAWNVNLQSGSEVAHLADMNGDGLADLVFKSAVQDVFFFRNEGGLNWAARQQMAAADVVPPAPFGSPEVKTADMDFDKRIDVVQSIDSGAGVDYRIWLNLGDQQYSTPITVSQPNGFEFSQPGVQIADFNGDRVPDLVRVFPSRVEAMAGLGYGRFADPISLELPDATLTGEQITRAKLTDLTGDGLADLVLERAGPGLLWYWINLGTYTLSARREITGMPTVTSQAAAVRWADLNGNGTTDLVYADSTSEPRLQTVDLGELINCGISPNSLRTISNGLGRVTLIDYQPSTIIALQDAAAGQPWPNLMPFPVPVVSAVTNLDSLGHAYVTQFRYHDGYYDRTEKQFRGFARVEQIEVGDATAPTLVTRSYFDTGSQYEVMKGKLLRLTVEQEDGKQFTDQVTTWTIPPRVLRTGTNGVPVQFVHPTVTATIVKELGQGAERRLESEADYDVYGNQTRSVDYGIVEGGDRAAFNDERIVTAEYVTNETSWNLRYPKRRETKSLAGVVISRTDYFYDDETFSGANFGVVGKGNLTLHREWIEPSNPTGYIQSSRHQYDAYGNAVVVLDPLAVAPNGVVDLGKGHARTVTYDDRFHTYAIRETIHVGGGKDPLVFRAIHDEAFGTLITGTDFNTNTISYTYDPFARLTAIIQPGDTTEYPTSEYSYALGVPFGALGVVNYTEMRLLDRPPGSRSSKLDHYMISREFIDGMGRTLMAKKEAEPQGTNPAPSVVVSGATTFNARRTASWVLNPFFSVAAGGSEALLNYENIEAPGWKGLFHQEGALVSVGLEAAHKTATRYDATQREVRSINPDGSVETTVYEPLVTRSYDANQSDPGSPHFGASMSHFEDGLGRLVRVDEIVRINDDGTRASTPNTWTTRYEYDLNDQLTRITDSQGNVKSMSYDGLTRKIFMNDPDRGLMRYVYDDASNLIETTDAKAQKITYTYDGANRLLSEDYHDDNARLPGFDPSQPITPLNRPDVACFYDTPVAGLDIGNGTTTTGRNTVGMLSYVWDLTGEEHYSYDTRERTTNVVKRVIDPLHGGLVSYRTGYASDSLNRLTTVLYPDDDFVQYEYNERSLGKRITGGPNGSIISNMLYSPAGQLTLVEYGNGVQTTSAYDTNLRLNQIRTRQPQRGLEHVAFLYEFDPASNVRSIGDLRPNSSILDGSPRRNNQTVDYDDLYRMTAVRYSFNVPGTPLRNDGEIQYRYDRIGNMLAQTSNIPHFAQGLSVTDLGAMAYGGAAGSTGRLGRQPNDPPGPHALTQIRNPKSESRNYNYDANGNMLEIDGLKTAWDFDDRLARVENDEGRAGYGYDHRDARIIKKVIAKTSGQTDTTVYVNRYFEVRQNAVATKHVWCANTRVARVTGTLSFNQRLQRLRLWSGWNLCSLAVTAANARAQLAASGVLAAVFRWDPIERGFKEVASSETVSAGTVLWIGATTNATVAFRGVYEGNVGPSQIPAGGVFHPGALLEPLSLESFAPTNAALWRFDGATQRWEARLSDALFGLSDLPESLAPGEGLFVHVDNEAALALPDPTLGIRYYHQDHLGSSAVITDANGVAVEETCFYPFGFPRHKQTSFKVSDPYQFAQKEYDRESGLNCLEARFQSPILGRFLRVDPLAGALKSSWLQEPQRLNLYAYCANSPLGNSDPSGTDLVGLFKGFGMGMADAAGEAGRDPFTAAVSVTVAVVEGAKHKAVQYGGVAVETSQGNYKKAFEIAL